MSIQLHTPSSGGTFFQFQVDTAKQIITITSEADNTFHYRLAAIRDLYLWLREEHPNEWVTLGTKNENETPNPGTVEAWARSPQNPVDGFYGITPGRRGRFASFIPPILEYLGLAEVEHNAQDNRIKAI